MDAGESAEDAVRREWLEETGMVAGTLRALGSFVDNGNQKCATGHYFVAHACRQVAAPEPGGFEQIELLRLTPAEVGAALTDGRIGVIHHAGLWAMGRGYL